MNVAEALPPTPSEAVTVYGLGATFGTSNVQLNAPPAVVVTEPEAYVPTEQPVNDVDTPLKVKVISVLPANPVPVATTGVPTVPEVGFRPNVCEAKTSATETGPLTGSGLFDGVALTRW